MAKKSAARRQPVNRKPPVHVPLPFDAAVDGILGMTPEAARTVNKKVAAKRRKVDGRKKPSR